MCGPAGTADCCASPDVPGGTFSRSNDASYPATVGAFGLDSYEVTVGRFRAFVHAGLGTAQNPPTEGSGGHPKLADSGWLSAWNDKLSADLDTLKADLKCDNTYATWTDLPDSHEAFPMNCLTWFEAFAFCAWDGGRLPTEAEWNLADAGGDEHRVFPWSQPADSDVIDPSFAVYACQGDGSGPADCAMSDILPVGSRFLKGNAKWGQSDLAGSMAEWMLDWHGIYPSPCVDCANTTLGLARVVRGGAFSDAKALLRTDYRTFALPAARGHDRGARCARSL
jgi:formylglycine-generating enzyme required for sulfatase activity